MTPACPLHPHQELATMGTLEKGITRNGTGFGGKTWNILGQVYFPKAVTDSTFAFETNSDPGQFVPVHIHPTQDEFILVQEGVLDLKLDGVWVQAKAGDLVRMPRGVPHGYFNRSEKPARVVVLGFADAETTGLVRQAPQPLRPGPCASPPITKWTFCRPKPATRATRSSISDRRCARS